MFYCPIDESAKLKLLETRYADELFALIDKDRTYLREWLPWVDGAANAEHTIAFIQSSLKQFADRNGFHAGIFFQDKIAGCIGLHGIDWNHRKTSIGYWLGAEYQGKGLMTRSCQAIIDYVVDELQLNRVEIRAAEFNMKSRAIPERLGFLYEGKARQVEWLNDHFVDHMIYGMLAEDWKKRPRRG